MEVKRGREKERKKERQKEKIGRIFLTGIIMQ